jgi:RHS repeat-associated protein
MAKPEREVTGFFWASAAYTLVAGAKSYELSNHLGNAMAVISDRGELQSAQDFYPFGMAMPGRSTDAKHRYGFNGKETDPETGIQDYGMRWYLPNIARFPSVDPITKKYPELTPYQFASNRPIDGIDLDGLEFKTTIMSNFFGGLEKMASVAQLQPFVMRVTYHTEITTQITQTGCMITQVTTMTISRGNYTQTYIGMRGGMDICTDGNGPHYNDGSPQPQTSLSGSWGTLNASTIDYVVLPDVIRLQFNIKIGDAAIVIGTTNTGEQLTKPAVTADASREHGAEVSLHLGWAYGYGRNPDGTPNANAGGPKNCAFEYWFAQNTSDTSNCVYTEHAAQQEPPTQPQGLCEGMCIYPTSYQKQNINFFQLGRDAMISHQNGKTDQIPIGITVQSPTH